jgi:hypothetical protein
MITGFVVGLREASRHVFTPRGLLLRAMGIMSAYGMLHACGLRDTLSVLCGTDASAGAAPHRTLVLASLYLLSYLGATVLAPVFCLTALFISLADRFSANAPKDPPP